MNEPRTADFWTRRFDGAAECCLCPRRCALREGMNGFCGVRGVRAGKLRSFSYGRPAAMQVDPIEKKPLAEFLPGSSAFSIGTLGCNLGCSFCQNDTLSRGRYDAFAEDAFPVVSPGEIVALALKHGCRSVAYTYNEPGVFAEYAIECAREVRRAGLANVLVTNGYLTPEAAGELYRDIDAANFDLKGFGDFYRDMCAGELTPVLANIEYFHRLGKHLELTNLVIPGHNDAPECVDALLDFVERRLGRETVLHFSAYFPCCKCSAPPTPRETLFTIRDRASARGFHHIYLGNIR